jgi:hypothetical protein
VAGFGVYVLGRILGIATLAGDAAGISIVLGTIIALWFSGLLLNAMRATFAYQVYQQGKASAASGSVTSAGENIANGS